MLRAGTPSKELAGGGDEHFLTGGRLTHGMKTKGTGVLTPVSPGMPAWLEVQDHLVKEYT